MSIFTLIVLTVLLSILWMPAAVCALVLKYRFGKVVSNLLWLVLPSQLILALALPFLLSEYTRLLNPMGYVLGITLSLSLVGAIFVIILGNYVASPTRERGKS